METVSEVVFDPSLLATPANTLLDDIMSADDFAIRLTKKAYQLMFDPYETDFMGRLMVAWGVKPEHVGAISNWMSDYRSGRLREWAIEPDPGFQDMKSFRLQIMALLRDRSNLDTSLLEFACDEISLAAYYKMPILCAETSSWKIVELLRDIGAKVKEEAKGYSQKKTEYFKTKRAWKEVAAEALGLAFVWIVTGPVGLLPSLGAPIIKALVVDP